MPTGVNRLLVLSNAGLALGTIDARKLPTAVLQRLGIRCPRH